jgi:hypothetical protein
VPGFEVTSVIFTNAGMSQALPSDADAKHEWRQQLRLR